ncbi:glycoside hydrolase, partial [bacterium]|nr:glycoside hydrolase [bacterium]
LHGFLHTEEVKSVGKPATIEADGPAEFVCIGQPKTSIYDEMPDDNTGFPNAGIIAQTWNTELAREMGYACGVEAGSIGASGWYAPAVNLHRSPLNGRSYEYYSEDSLLSGIMCGNAVAGAKDAGVYCFVKHLVCNDGEAGIYRDGVYIWLTEQTLREIYLKPFRIVAEEFGGTGIMSSYSRIGAVWAGGSRALLTGVLRGEWNFRGAVISDYSDHNEYTNADQMLRAGGDLWMDGDQGNGRLACETSSATFQQSMRRACKNIIYVYLNARVSNLDYAAAKHDDALIKPHTVIASNTWRQLLVGFDVLAAVVFALALVCWRRQRKLR